MNVTLLLSLLLVLSGCQSMGPDRGGAETNSSSLSSGNNPSKPTPNAVPSVETVETPSPRAPVFINESEERVTENPNLPLGRPELTTPADSWIISRPQYVISWNPKTFNINWAAWLMNPSQLGLVGRAEKFTVDPALEAYLVGRSIKSITRKDYTGTCFDRGHQVASGDRQGSEADNRTTFYMTNIIPQTAFLNQVIWRTLEDDIKDWLKTAKYKNLWIVSGPIYGEHISYIGPLRNIAVPKSNFKAIFAWDDNSKDKPYLVKAVNMPNVLSKGEDPLADRTLLCKESTSGGRSDEEGAMPLTVDSYETTLDAIEAAAHLKFPAVLENLVAPDAKAAPTP